MAVTGVTYRYEFGSSVDQDGLNAISAGLRLSRPDLFTHSATVVVKPADPGQPPSTAHSLTIYAVVNTPLAFNLYPVDGAPTLPIDSLMVQADISFSLTDSLLGLVTRIGVTAQATANIQVADDTATIALLSFNLTDIEGEQPQPGGQAGGASQTLAAPLAPAVAQRLGDDPLADAFRAIVNYLVELYLKQALETAVTSFPLPSLNKLTGFGGLGTVPITGVFVRNKAIYLTAGADLGAPSTFPGPPAHPADIRIGASQTGLRRAIAAFLPLPVPIDVGGSSLHLTGQLNISEIDVSLPPGAAGIPTKINIGGNLNLHVEVPIPVFGGTLKFDVPIPVDYLTQYDGTLFSALTVGKYPDDPSAKVTIGLAPDVSFLGAWVAFVVTDYRDYLSNAFARAVQDAANQLVGNSFCNIPVIGWIVCGVIDVTAQVLGYLTGAILDFFLSTLLTGLVNTLGRVLFLFFASPTFDVLSIDQSDLYNATGLSIASAQVDLVENGRDGDLQLSAWFSDQGLPIPPAPAPVQPLPAPQPAPVPPYPNAPTLPEYGAADFQPAVTEPLPAWTDGQTQHYSVNVVSPNHPGINPNTSAALVVEKLGNGWRLSLTTMDGNGAKISESHAEYDAQNIAAQRLERVNYGANPTTHQSLTTRQVVDCSQPGQIVGSFGIDGGASVQQTIPSREGVPIDFEDFWPFRFASAPMVAAPQAKFGTPSIADPHAAANWVREIPVTVAVADGTLQWSSGGAPPALNPVWIVTATEEGKQTEAYVAKSGAGLLKLVSQTDEATITMLRL